MSCDVSEFAERRPFIPLGAAVRLAVAALRRMRGRSISLDLDSTSDYMKKDLGLLDGRMARRDDDILR